MISRAVDRFVGEAVHLEGVHLNYGAGEAVLCDVSLTLKSGDFAFVTGASGAGKTTLLKLIYLALKPTRGTAHVFGRATDRVSRSELAALRRRIGMVFQEFRLLEHLSAFDNVALPLRVAGQKPADYRTDVEELLRWVGLGGRLNAKPSTLSGGEQQRVAIARALVNTPDLLIADEPTGNVDPEMGARLMRLFAELNRRLGTTVLVATHDLGLIRQFPAQVLRLQSGLLVRDVEFGGAA